MCSGIQNTIPRPKPLVVGAGVVTEQRRRQRRVWRPELRGQRRRGGEVLPSHRHVGVSGRGEKEELIAPQLQDYKVAIAAAEQCDKSVECWIGKLKDKDKIVIRKATNMLARYARGNDAAIKAMVDLFSHSDLEVRNEALAAVDAIAINGSDLAVKKIDELEAVEAGRSIWNNFKREALPTRSRLQTRGAAS